MESIWALAAKARAVSNINDRNAIVDFEIKPPIYRYYALPVKHFDFWERLPITSYWLIRGTSPEEFVQSMTIEVVEDGGIDPLPCGSKPRFKPLDRDFKA